MLTPKPVREITQICDVFRGKIIDVSTSSLIIEVTGNENKIKAFLELLDSFGVTELARTGTVSLRRERRLIYSLLLRINQKVMPAKVYTKKRRKYRPSKRKRSPLLATQFTRTCPRFEPQRKWMQCDYRFVQRK